MADIFDSLGWLINVADILIVAVVIYWLILLVKNTRAERMLWGLGIIVVVFFVSGRMELLTLHWILSNFLSSMVIIIIVIFQHDIRRVLIQVGKSVGTGEWSGKTEFVDEIAKAVALLSSGKIGALIALERDVGLKDYIELGTEIDAKATKDMLLSIFNQTSPLHDGAVIVQDGRLTRAGCLLPLTIQDVSKQLGTRHRAALGLSEETDAVVVVVSEETGELSLVVGGNFERNLDIDTLSGRLKNLLKMGVNVKQTLAGWAKS
ncbi:MAG: diadenylate cyclase CdaA [Thermodesulfobacteriota bacterium]